ncbi:MAG TPA: hypothetical protein ENH91_11365 [Leeuwenhoekiella sp.]|nr:hypothetical protein [Leeuwenhoekiella sp.]
MKRTTIITLTILLIAFSARAQKEFRKSLSGVSRIAIETETSIKVLKGTTNELIIKEGCADCMDKNDMMSHFQKKEDTLEDERIKGLTPIYAGGKDNTEGIGLYMDQDGEVLRLKDLKSFFNRSGLTITVPSSAALIVNCGNMGSAVIEGLTSELEIETTIGLIELNNVTGPVTAHSSVGNINAVFTNVNQDAPISISSSTGIIDVSLPTTTKASVELKSTMGTVFTNFDLVEPREDGLKAIGGNRSIQGDLNNGGVKISLKASTGNIYLRKK